ncbi:MAG: hypothetical protein ABI675_20770 [Chitinophagaceae bacterium]
MKLNQLSVILLLIGFLSCKSKAAFDYSEAIVKMENELSADIAEIDLKVSEYLEAKKTDSAIMMTRQMESLADGKLKEIQNLEAPKVKEGDNFKKEAVRYFSYIKSLYTSLNRLEMAATDEQKEIERNRLARIIKDKKEVSDAMQEAQRIFATANNFSIRKADKKIE